MSDYLFSLVFGIFGFTCLSHDCHGVAPDTPLVYPACIRTSGECWCRTHEHWPGCEGAVCGTG